LESPPHSLCLAPTLVCGTLWLMQEDQ
jgi:hypothetical protein